MMRHGTYLRVNHGPVRRRSTGNMPPNTDITNHGDGLTYLRTAVAEFKRPKTATDFGKSGIQDGKEADSNKKQTDGAVKSYTTDSIPIPSNSISRRGSFRKHPTQNNTGSEVHIGLYQPGGILLDIAVCIICLIIVVLFHKFMSIFQE